VKREEEPSIKDTEVFSFIVCRGGEEKRKLGRGDER